MLELGRWFGKVKESRRLLELQSNKLGDKRPLPVAGCEVRVEKLNSQRATRNPKQLLSPYGEVKYEFGKDQKKH